MTADPRGFIFGVNKTPETAHAFPFTPFKPAPAAAKPAVQAATHVARGKALDAEPLNIVGGMRDAFRDGIAERFAAAQIEMTDEDIDRVVIAVSAAIESAIDAVIVFARAREISK